MVKKVISWVINAVSIALIVFAVAILVTVVFTKQGEAPNILGYSAFRVLTPSMEPTIPVDTMVVVKRTGAENIQLGDVITFYSEDPEILGQVNTHRVYDIRSDDYGQYFVTKGDNNLVADEAPVRPENLIGKVVWQTTFFGKIVSLTTNPLVFVLFIAVPLAIFLIMNIIQTVKTVKEIEKEELEEDVKRLEEALAEKEADGTAPEGEAARIPAGDEDAETTAVESPEEK